MCLVVGVVRGQVRLVIHHAKKKLEAPLSLLVPGKLGALAQQLPQGAGHLLVPLAPLVVKGEPGIVSCRRQE